MDKIEIMNDLKVGSTRIRDTDGFLGTVVYLGPVSSAKNPDEIYAGIIWDDATRGKHDGSVICRRTNRLVRHFSCGPTAGSFLRLNKLDTGVALDEVLLKSKYVEQNAELVAPGNLLEHCAMTSRGREKPIEFLGELKIRERQQLPLLEKISLRSLGIARASDPPISSELCGRLTQIDLAGNLLADWGEVVSIFRQFPNIENVSVASNRIGDLESSEVLPKGAFSKFKGLNLNHCGLRTFATVMGVDVAAPHLQELCVAYNDFSDMDSFDDVSRLESVPPPLLTSFRHLTLLDCSKCSISSWDRQVRRLRKLPCLATLILDDNSIPYISTIKSTEDTNEFPALKSLQIAGNAMETWTAIDALSEFPELTYLRFRNNPVTNNVGTGEARSMVIARIPNIRYLNASLITEKERMEAERRYVRTVARDLLVLTDSNADENPVYNATEGEDSDAIQRKKAEILKNHPRFEDLMQKHKDSMISVTAPSTAAAGSLSHDTINVTIRSMAPSSCNIEPLQKRLPSSLLVGRLKIICGRAFDVDVDLQALHFRVDNDPFPTELDDDKNPLSYYGVRDGAEIFMNEIDTEADARESARRDEDFNRRVVEQEQFVRELRGAQWNEHRGHNFAAAADCKNAS